MNRSGVTLVIAVGFALLVTAARADEPTAAVDPAVVQEQIARDGINALRAASRDLRKLARDAGSSGATGVRADAFAAWIDDARKAIDRLAQRWVSDLDLYQRDFPREALEADPERHAYAVEWLGDVNGSLTRQAAELRQDLLERNASFAPDLPAPLIDATRARIEQIGS